MKTRTFTVDAIGNPEPVVAQTFCREIIIYEDNQLGTQDYIVKAPSSSDPAITRPSGSVTNIKPLNTGSLFSPTEVAAYVATTAGSITMAQEEQ